MHVPPTQRRSAAHSVDTAHISPTFFNNFGATGSSLQATPKRTTASESARIP
jgi:hypothetical protein